MMEFLIKSNLSLLLFLAFYYLVLEKEKMHQFNRFFLLFSVVISLAIPFITFEIIKEIPVAAMVESMYLPTQISLETAPKPETIDYRPIVLWSLYGIVTLFLAIRFGRNIWKLISKSKTNPSVNYKNAQLVLVKEKTLPHTFLNSIFINSDDYNLRTIEDELYTHELVHVTQKHTLDILFMEFLKTIFWFNPLFYFYKKAIQLNHEFLADEKVVTSYNNVLFYQSLLLQKGNGTPTIYLASNLNYLVTKKRLIMMTKTTSQSRALLKRIAVIPVLAGIMFISCTKTDPKLSSTSPEVYLNGKKLNDSDVQKPLSELVKSGKFPNQKVKVTTSETAITSSVEVKEVDPKDVSSKPEFPGGIQKFYDFVGQNFKMPNVKDLRGRVFLKFIVEADGSLTNIEIVRDIGHGTGEEAVRVLKLSPKWIPGEENGKKVRVLYSLPISIQGN